LLEVFEGHYPLSLVGKYEAGLITEREKVKLFDLKCIDLY